MKDIKQEELINYNEGLTVIDVWAPWCGPCRMLIPVLTKLSEEIKDVNFVKINADENSDFCVQYDVRNVPTVLFMKDGVIVDRFVGIKPRQFILDKIAEFKG